MPHTRRARELGLSRVVIGPWDKSNERFKLRLCWGEQCIALCLGDNGMTEIRVSLNYIALEDCGDGRIQLKMVPRFPRKFFGHTVNNHNSLREIRQDPCGGILDTQCKAVCYVRGGDPVKLAKDFVIRVEKFRLEINKPEPNSEALSQGFSVPPQPNIPLGPRSTNGPPWRKTLSNGPTFVGNSPMGNFGATNMKGNPQFLRGVGIPNTIQTYKNDRPWVVNGMGGTVPTTPIRYPRGEENGTSPKARFYAPPPTPAESEGQAEQPQKAQFKVDQILPTLVRKASKDRLPPRPENPSMKTSSPISEGKQETPNPMMAALLQGSIPEVVTYQERNFPIKGRGEENQPVNQPVRRNSILSEFHHGPTYASPTREYRPNRSAVYSTPKSTMSSIMSCNPSPVTSSMDSSIGTSNPSPPRTPYWELKDGMAATWVAHGMNQPGLQPNVIFSTDILTKPNTNLINEIQSQCIVLRHKFEQSPGGVTIRPAPAKSSLAELSVLAAYYWTIPLEELKLYGNFQGERVMLENERDWQGYNSVCFNVGDKIIIDVHREKMGGINRCSSDVDCQSIWGPLPIQLGPVRSALSGNPSNSSNGTNRNNSVSSDPFTMKQSIPFFAPKSLGVIGGNSDKGGTLQPDSQR